MKNKFLTKLLCFVITIMMIIPSGITFVAAEETEEDPFVALADYGVYTFANADGDEISNLAVESGNKRNKLYKKSEMEQALADGVNADFITNLKTGEYSSIDCDYFGGDAYDGPWRYENIGDKDAWFTTKFIRNGKGLYGPTNIHFNLKNDDIIGINDNEVTILVEYFDKADTNFSIRYWSTESHKTVAPTFAGSNEWKVAALSINNAKFTSGNEETGLGSDQKADFRVETGSEAYISRVMVVKTSDYEKYLAGELEETDDVVVANAKAALKLDVTEAKANFTLPTVDGVNVVWSSNNSAIAVDGNNAVVTQGAADITVTLTATISKGNVTDTKIFTVTVPAKYKKAAGAEIIIGATPEQDETVGGIEFDAGNSLFKRDKPETVAGSELMYETDLTADWDTMRVQAGPENDKRWAAFTSNYYRPNRKDSLSCGGNIPFNISEFSETDNKLTFEIDYLDVGTGSLGIRYITDAAKKSATTSITKTDTGAWKTWKVTLKDVKFSESNSSSGLGKSDKADIRIESMGNDNYISRVEVYTSKAYKDVIGAKQALNIDNVYDENGVEVANGTISSNFELPSTVEGFEGSEVTWESSNTDAIVFEGNVAKVQLSETGKQTVTITAKIVMDDGFVQKSFDVTLAKKPRNLYFVSDAVVTGEKTDKANVAFDITNAADIIGKEVSLVVASIDEETDQILKINVVRKDVKDATLDIEATVDNAKGKLAYYLTMDNGAVIYNIAPDPIQNFKVCSTEKGINIKWDTPADDNMFIKKYVIYDGNDNVVDTISGDENSYFVPLAKKETRSYCMEGFDHAGLSTGKTEVKMGSLFKASGITVKLYDLNGKGSNKAMFNDYLTNPNTDNHSHEKEMTDEVTKEKIICRHTLKRVSTTDGYCSCGATLRAENNNKPTCLYFKPDGDYVTKDTKEVAVIVKYYDYGKGKMNVEYNTYENMVKDLHCGGETKIELTGTNTFKTAVLKIYNAGFFSPSALSNADIRFSGGPDNEVYIAELKMMPLDNYMDQDDHIIYTVGK